MGKISVLYIIDSFMDLGGAERNLFEVVTRLNKDKFKPIVYALQASSSLTGALRERGIEANDLKIKKIYAFKAIKEGIKLIKFIKKENIKIVVTYHESSDFWGGLIAKISGVKVIISSRRDMGYKLKKNHIIVYKLINPLFDKIITVSDAVKSIIFEREKVLWHKMITIHNGVELEKFSKDFNNGNIKMSLSIKNDRPVIGVLAALRPIKGHKYFLEAASLVSKEFPDAYFLIVGCYDKNENYYNELVELARKLNLERNVIFTGGRQDTPGMLSIMDISVLPSINEGFSNTILESMAMRIPVVATNTGGSPEAVVDGQTGILVPPCNANALASAILKLLRDKKLAEEMGKAGRKRAEEFFSIDMMIKKIEKLYLDLLEKKIYKEKFAIKFYPKTISRLFSKVLKSSFGIFLYYSGIFTLFKKMLPYKRGIKILAYHRISDDVFDPLDMNIRVENFEKQMRFLKKNYEPVSLEKAVKLLQTKENIPDNLIVVTFDDGYRDNYINAYPILNKYEIPADIFLSVEAIEKKQVLWFDAIINAFKQTNRDYIELNEFGINRCEINSLNERMDTVKKIVSFAKNISIKDRNKMVDLVCKKLNVVYEDTKSNYPMLNWEDVKEMNNNSLNFGSHGLSHSILTKLTEEEMETEIRESKKIIEEKVNSEVKFFTYPNGRLVDFDERAIYLLKKHGYTAACTLIRGANNDSSNLYLLKRLCVNYGMESGILGNFSKVQFATEISGFYNLFKKTNYS